jgi:hypothetical protein
MKCSMTTESSNGGKVVQNLFWPSSQQVYSTEREENACAVRSVHVGEAPFR